MKTRLHGFFVALVLFVGMVSSRSWGAPRHAAEPLNLALHKTSYSSSIENDEHGAAQANDGDPETSWRADDEPEDGPEWWMVDLGKPYALSGCEIRWPYAGKKYHYKVEGSSDRKNWSLLSDQTHTNATTPIRELKFKQNAERIRYVKITVTDFEEGCWASISEVKIFGSDHAKPKTPTP